MGHELDMRHLGKSNLVVVTAAISRACNERTGHGVNERHDFSHAELATLHEYFDEIVTAAIANVLDG